MSDIEADYVVADDLSDLDTDLTAVSDRVTDLEADSVSGLSTYLSVDTSDDEIVFSGANVFVDSGAGSTEQTPLWSTAPLLVLDVSYDPARHGHYCRRAVDLLATT